MPAEQRAGREALKLFIFMPSLTSAHRLAIGKDPNYFGTLLSCTEEKELPVFVVCTAIDTPAAPPGLFPAGRLDRVFPSPAGAPEFFELCLVIPTQRLSPTATTCMTAKEEPIYAL